MDLAGEQDGIVSLQVGEQAARNGEPVREAIEEIWALNLAGGRGIKDQRSGQPGPWLSPVLGNGFSRTSERSHLITGSAIEFAPRVVLQRITALRHERPDFPVLAYTLPPEIGVEGMLGLDFLRGLELTMDFRQGEIALIRRADEATEGHRWCPRIALKDAWEYQ